MNAFFSLPIAGPLLLWYKQNRRSLPWRQTRDPYAIWVSEIMLQQTRVETVIPYYHRFLQALPTVYDLAMIGEEPLLKLWEGLGYYSRVRNMQRAAKILCEHYGGNLPQDPKLLEKLPGIGAYTAGAIASIAYNVAVPAVDGNALRVLARLCECTLDITKPDTKKQAWHIMNQMLQGNNPGALNQAVMELGATVCLPNALPLCDHCALYALCLARKNGTAPQLPVAAKKSPRKVEQHTVLVLCHAEGIAIRKRGAKGILAGLWELPNLEGFVAHDEMALWLSQNCISPSGEITCYNRKHIFTHVEWHMRVYALYTQDATLPSGFIWAKEQGEQALPTAFRVCLPAFNDLSFPQK